MLPVDNNKPDLMIYDKRTKEITLIEVGITNKDIIDKTELTKASQIWNIGQRVEIHTSNRNNSNNNSSSPYIYITDWSLVPSHKTF